MAKATKKATKKTAKKAVKKKAGKKSVNKAVGSSNNDSKKGSKNCKVSKVEFYTRLIIAIILVIKGFKYNYWLILIGLIIFFAPPLSWFKEKLK